MEAVITTDDVFKPEFPVFLEFREVARRTSLSRTTMDRMIADGSFPSPVKISRNRKAWIEDEVTKWQMELIEAREVA